MFCVKTLSFPVESALRVSRRCTSVGSTRVTPTGAIAHAASVVVRSSMIATLVRRFTLQYYDGREGFGREERGDLGLVRNFARGRRGWCLRSADDKMDVGRGGRRLVRNLHGAGGAASGKSRPRRE